MSYWMEVHAREKVAEQLRAADAWRLYRIAEKPAPSPNRPHNRRRLAVRHAR